MTGTFVFGRYRQGTDFAPAGPPGQPPLLPVANTRRGIVDGVPDFGAGVRRRHADNRCTPAAGSPLDVPRRRVGSRHPRRPANRAIPALVRRLGFLPADVRVRDIGRAPAGSCGFTPALRRHYATDLLAPYGVEPGPLSPPGPGRWTSNAMAASRDLLGLHDFAAFSAGTGLARPPSATCAWTGPARATWSPPGSAPTPSAGRWWSLVVRCWPWGGPTRTRLVRNAAPSAAARSSDFAALRAADDRRRPSPDDQLAERIVVTRDLRAPLELARHEIGGLLTILAWM